MGHGRKTKSKRFSGYKRHLAMERDTKLILAAAVLPANCPEHEAVPSLTLDIASHGFVIGALHTGTAYIVSELVGEVLARGGQVQPMVLGETARFPAEVCRVCPMRPKCTNAKGDRGRTVSIARDEPLQQELHAIEDTPVGRERLRERIPIEHRQGTPASGRGRMLAT